MQVDAVKSVAMPITLAGVDACVPDRGRDGGGQRAGVVGRVLQRPVRRQLAVASTSELSITSSGYSLDGGARLCAVAHAHYQARADSVPKSTLTTKASPLTPLLALTSICCPPYRVTFL